MTPTKEDVLKKHVLKDKEMDADMYNDWSKQESYQLMLAAMQEWASLQTPSNEKYGWVKALERLPSKHDVVCVRYKADGKMFYCPSTEWYSLENLDVEWLDETPIPIQTPCGWVEIESAPKDGSRIIGYDPNTEEIYIVWWNRTMGDGCWNNEGHRYIPKITHWMPLPTKPNL